MPAEWSSDPTVLAVIIGLGFAFLIAVVGIGVMMARWIFRVNPMYESMQTLEKQLGHVEELLSAIRAALNDMAEKPEADESDDERSAPKPGETRDLEHLLAQVPDKTKRERPVTARVIRPSGVIPAPERPAAGSGEKKDGWDSVIRESEQMEDEVPPVVIEGEREPVPDGEASPPFGGADEASGFRLEELSDDFAAKSPSARVSDKADETRPAAPPHVPSVVSIEEVTAALGDQEETSSDLPSADPIRVVAKSTTDTPDGKVVTAHILVAREAAPASESEFSNMVNKGVRGFFDEYPHAYSIKVGFYSEWHGKYLLVGTYEWITHTSLEGGVKEFWRLRGAPDTWTTFDKDKAPWK